MVRRVGSTKPNAGSAKPSRRVLTYDDVLVGARTHFLRHGTITLDDLAKELAVSRATMYRLIHGRDELLGDVLWQLGEPLLRDAIAKRGTASVDAILEISLDFYRAMSQAAAFRRFLADEPGAAVRVLFTPAGGVHARAVKVQKEIFEQATADGLELADDLDGLAYLYVRIIESLLYADLLSGRESDLALIERAARAVLAVR